MTAPAPTTRPIVPTLRSARAKLRKAGEALALAGLNVPEAKFLAIGPVDELIGKVSDLIDGLTVESGTPMGADEDDDESEPTPEPATRPEPGVVYQITGKGLVKVSDEQLEREAAERAARIAAAAEEPDEDPADSPDAGLVLRTEAEIATFPMEGDIYSTSWGYDQTNVEFFKVVRRTEKTAILRAIGSTVHNRRVYPLPDVEIIDAQLAGNRGSKQYEIDHERGYSEKVCRAKKGNQPFGWLTIDDVRGASPYTGGGAHDTIAAGYPGH